MSYVALATNAFDEVTRFYGERLGLPVIDGWDRANGRGRRYDLSGLTLEILDNARQHRPVVLSPPADRIHLVVEVDDIETARDRLGAAVPPAQDTSWGAALFVLRDPDGVPVTFLEWRGGGEPT